MSELDELKDELKIAVKLKFDKREIDKIQNLIKQKEEKNVTRQRKSNVDNIHYPYGTRII